MALSYDNDHGVFSVLDDDHRDQLLDQWHAYRSAMEATNPPPFKLEYDALAAGSVTGGRAEVTVDVSARWRSADDSGRLSGFASGEKRWHFQTREDDGWRVVKVTPPAWCGDYVPSNECG